MGTLLARDATPLSRYSRRAANEMPETAACIFHRKFDLGDWPRRLSEITDKMISMYPAVIQILVG